MFLAELVLSARRALVVLVSFSLALAALTPLAVPAPARAAETSVFINEIHYDNAGTDAGEFVEVAGPAGTDLTGWTIVLYNGNGGVPYDTDALPATIPNQQNGFGAVSIEYPVDGVQNGSPDAIALVDGTTVVQFVSYEGTVTATDGVADGMTSTDIGVAEPNTAPVGTSMSLQGTGTIYEAFTWATGVDDTPGAVNAGQTFGADPTPQVDCGPPVATTTGVEATTSVSAADANGRVVSLAITEVVPEDSNITIGATTPAPAAGGTATATVTVGAATAAGTYAVEITATNDDGTPQTGTCTLSVTVTSPVTTGIVISQVYGGGGNSGSTLRNDFIELFNWTDESIPIDGWSVQYAATAGVSWQVTTLTGSIPAGGYYLVHEAAQGGGTQDLPAADATGAIPMAAGNGKVALSASSTVLTGSCPAGLVDMVGYGTANCFEGTAAAPGLTASTAAIRDRGGCEDTDQNGADFTAGTPTPRNSASDRNPCSAEQAPAILSTFPSNGSVEVAIGATIGLEFSEPVAVTGDWFQIACSVSGAHTATVSGGPTSFVLDPDTEFESGDRCTVTISAAGVTDTDPVDPPDAMEADVVFAFAVGEICGNPSNLISEIQGAGLETSFDGDIVTIEGVVVGDYQGSDPGLGGFYLQEEDADADSDPLTSEGIFVNDPSTTTEVAAGDLVSVTGTAGEGFDQTQVADLIDVTLCESEDEPDATPAEVSLPVEEIDDLEPFEGMLVSFDETLTVTETFGLGRFGELVLSVDGRQYASTHLAEPGPAAEAQFDLTARSRITLDDGDGSQNDDPTRYPTGGLSADNTLRVGSTVDDLTAVLGFGFSLYRLQPVGEIDFDLAPRPAGPPDVGGRIQVAAFNVLNYFNGEPAGNFADPDNRGAETAFEFDRQRTKIIEAIAAIDAEVVGLMEIENDDSTTADTAAIEDLVAGLNAKLGGPMYDFIETGKIGTDAIAVAIIYQPGEVTPLGDHAILTSEVDPAFNDELNRPALAQSFTENATGSAFTVAVNHLKSKGSDCGGAPDDQPDYGGGNCNGTRTAAAAALATWLDSDPTGSGDADAFIIGDLNSYRLEDPIDALKAGGFTDLLAQFEGDDAYTYVFQGWSGYLDHALATDSALAQVTDAAPWHINADEPTVLDYNTNFKSPTQVTTLYAPDEFRASDHDPVIVGLDLDAAPVITSLDVTEIASVGQEVELSASFTDANTDETHTATVDWGDGSTEPATVAGGTVEATHEYVAAGIHTVTLTVTDSTGLSDAETFRYAVVFDRAAGFVVGGGRIATDDGIASFELSVKYQATGAAPNGSVTFEVEGLAFEATSIDWLVVDGSAAWMSGTGTVNGAGGYEFVLAVTDSPDRLRLQITDGDELVFDNQPGDPIDAAARRSIRNGQIKIQAGRGPGATLAPGI